MKKLILLFMAAGLVSACEQRIEAPDAPAVPAKEENTTIINPPAEKADTEVKVESTETKVETPAPDSVSTESTTTTTTETE